MASYRIKEAQDHLEVKLDDTGAGQDELLAAFQECQQGRCSCPTSEYEKLESMEIRTSEDQIELRLKPRPGTTLEATEIAHCLDYTVERASKAK